MPTTAELEARIAELEKQLRELQKSRYGARTVIEEVFPSAARDHMRASWREQLLAIRSLLDHWIAKSSGEDGATKRRESISVE